MINRNQEHLDDDAGSPEKAHTMKRYSQPEKHSNRKSKEDSYHEKILSR